MPHVENMRLFIAVDLPPLVKNALVGIQTMLQKSGADAKWVEPSNIHLTLKFLGATDAAKIQAITELLNKLFSKTKIFPVTLSRLGAFPQKQSPHVIWAGLDDASHILKDCALQLNDALKEMGFEKETREFRSHVTLARVRSPRNKIALIEHLDSAQKDLKTIIFSIDNITLFESKLSPKEPTYRVLHQVKFL